MKKNLVTVTTMIAALSVPALALAATGSHPCNIAATDTTVLGSQTITPSNNVTIRVNSDGTIYAAKSAHGKGDRIFGVNSGDTKIYYYTITTNTDPTADTTNFAVGSSSIDFSSWSSL
jgi:hypothetical protein